MSMKKPELRDFGVTPEEYVLYVGKGDPPPWPSKLIAILSVAVSVGFVLTLDTGLVVTKETLFLDDGFSVGDILPGAINGFFVGSLILVLVLFVIGIPVNLIYWAIVRFKRSRLMASPVASRIKLYEEAEAAYQAMQAEVERAQQEAERAQREAERRQREAERARHEAEMARRRKIREHWMSLSGPEFERELGTLFSHMGYRVESTPVSGDQGIDLILRKDGKTTVVQCKSHRKPVGPAVARELYGSMVASHADSAILACTGGFTRGVEEFVRGKPIALVSASEIATLGEGVEVEDAAASDLAALGGRADDQRDEARDGALIYPLPICPMPGCGKTMVLRGGRSGRFWACLGYPRCRGTRDI